MTVSILCVTATMSAMPASGGARSTMKPDLLISHSSVRSANGSLSGSFTIRSAGSVRARRSSAALSIQVAGKNRVLKRFAIPALRRSASLKVRVISNLPDGLPAGSFRLRVCADGLKHIRELSERNNCRAAGTLRLTPNIPFDLTRTNPVSSAPTSSASPAGSPASTTQTDTPPAVPTISSSVPTDPTPFTDDTVFTLSSPLGNYWVYVPVSYDETHATPFTLFVWLHGCGGVSAGDIYTVSPGADQSFISIAVGGREGGCWNVNNDPALVMAAIANVKTHFNINPRRVIIGGYSSGGDLAYRTAYYNANTFAGVLAENATPFRDTGSTQSASIAAAAWKFNVVHLAHIEDATYPIAIVRNETDALTNAGFPMTRIEKAGSHYDPDAGNTGTNYDLRTFLLPHLDDPWLSP